MFAAAKAGPIGVVVKLDEVFAPPEEERMPRGEQGVDADEKGIGPGGDGAEGGGRPVECADELGHLARAEDAAGGAVGRGGEFIVTWR